MTKGGLEVSPLAGDTISAFFYNKGTGMEPTQGERGLWHVGTVGFATREQAQAYIDRGMTNSTIKPQAPAIGTKPGAKVARLFLGAAVAVIAVAWFVISRPASPEKVQRQAQMAGLLICQKAIAATAKYGKAEYPPFPEMTVSGAGFAYIWAPGSFHFQNGYGADVPQSALCVVNQETGKIISLVISGQRFI